AHLASHVEHVQRTVHGGSDGPDRILLVVHRRGQGRPDEKSGRLRSPPVPMFLREPVKKLSRHITSWPSDNSRSHRCDPRKPAPPVSRIRNILDGQASATPTVRKVISIVP